MNITYSLSQVLEHTSGRINLGNSTRLDLVHQPSVGSDSVLASTVLGFVTGYTAGLQNVLSSFTNT